MKLKNLPQCSGLSGGASIELLAKEGNPRAFQFPQVMTRLPDCHFSFAGIKFAAKKLIKAEEERLSTSCWPLSFRAVIAFLLQTCVNIGFTLNSGKQKTASLLKFAFLSLLCPSQCSCVAPPSPSKIQLQRWPAGLGQKANLKYNIWLSAKRWVCNGWLGSAENKRCLKNILSWVWVECVWNIYICKQHKSEESTTCHHLNK